MDSSDSENEQIQRHAKISLKDLKKENKRGRPKAVKKEDETKSNFDSLMSDYNRLKEKEEQEKIKSKVETHLPVQDRFQSAVENELKTYLSSLHTDNRFFGNVLKNLSKNYLGPDDSDQPENIFQTVSNTKEKEKKNIILPSENQNEEAISSTIEKISKTRKPKSVKIVYDTETSTTETDVEKKKVKKVRKQNVKKTKEEKVEEITNVEIPITKSFQKTNLPTVSFF